MHISFGDHFRFAYLHAADVSQQSWTAQEICYISLLGPELKDIMTVPREGAAINLKQKVWAVA